MKPTVLITGAGGLIGSYVVRTTERWGHRWRACGVTRADADLTDQEQVETLWRRIKPQAVIHCAALSRTGACEGDPARARMINVETTARLAELGRQIPFIFLSSDQVFDGKQGSYVETDAVNALNTYGKTKAEAERLVLQNPAHSVLRVALTGGSTETRDRSFVEDMLRACGQGHTLTLFTDEFRCPLPAGAVARTVWELLALQRPGLYHLGGSERLSRWDIGQALTQRYPELLRCLQPGSLSSYTGPPRPADLSMRSDKLQSLLSFPLPGWRQWLRSAPHAAHDLWDYPLS